MIREEKRQSVNKNGGEGRRGGGGVGGVQIIHWKKPGIDDRVCDAGYIHLSSFFLNGTDQLLWRMSTAHESLGLVAYQSLSLSHILF